MQKRCLSPRMKSSLSTGAGVAPIVSSSCIRGDDFQFVGIVDDRGGAGSRRQINVAAGRDGRRVGVVESESGGQNSAACRSPRRRRKAAPFLPL